MADTTGVVPWAARGHSRASTTFSLPIWTHRHVRAESSTLSSVSKYRSQTEVTKDSSMTIALHGSESWTLKSGDIKSWRHLRCTATECALAGIVIQVIHQSWSGCIEKEFSDDSEGK